jgi:hypothetical protein
LFLALRPIAIAALAFAVIACNPSTPARPAPTPEPTLEAPVESPSPAELEAIRFRTEFGLRADLAYVRAVAANPSASSLEFAVPLMPAELADLNGRSANADAVRDAVREYTDLHPSEFAGVYVDQQHGGAFTTLWTGHLDEHAAAIQRRVRPGTKLAFRLVMYPYRDLRALQERIGRDTDWMRALAIAIEGVGVDVIGNRVDIDVSSANPNATSLILAHYAAPFGMIKVTSDGTGAELVPWGTVHGHVVDSAGKAPGETVAGKLNIDWTSDGPGTCGGGDVGFGVADGGGFELPCQAGGHTIQIEVLDALRAIGRGHVVAVQGETANLTITLDTTWAKAVAP